ncbi:hypothetical protein ColTof3_00050 [Colletotrichum tofieldiae]|nr:hypothetical protein ColTof3_00050 [Colletotrichum tofieldiae]
MASTFSDELFRQSDWASSPLACFWWFGRSGSIHTDLEWPATQATALEAEGSGLVCIAIPGVPSSGVGNQGPFRVVGLACEFQSSMA